MMAAMVSSFFVNFLSQALDESYQDPSAKSTPNLISQPGMFTFGNFGGTGRQISGFYVFELLLFMAVVRLHVL